MTDGVNPQLGMGLQSLIGVLAFFKELPRASVTLNQKASTAMAIKLEF
jgi:hypothetical protein